MSTRKILTRLCLDKDLWDWVRIQGIVNKKKTVTEIMEMAVIDLQEKLQAPPKPSKKPNPRR